MKVIPTPIAGLVMLEPRVFEDERGFFFESYNQVVFSPLGIDKPFVQDNQSRSRKGVLRGMHYQVRQSQAKLVRVIRGEVYDVCVDLRKQSPTLGQWYGACLSAGNHRQLYIPPEFAHGFLVLSDWADVLYKVTDFYAPQYERCIIWNDKDLKIEWPSGIGPILSAKDAKGLSFAEAELFDR